MSRRAAAGGPAASRRPLQTTSPLAELGRRGRRLVRPLSEGRVWSSGRCGWLGNRPRCVHAGHGEGPGRLLPGRGLEPNWIRGLLKEFWGPARVLGSRKLRGSRTSSEVLFSTATPLLRRDRSATAAGAGARISPDSRRTGLATRSPIPSPVVSVLLVLALLRAVCVLQAR